MADQQTTPSYYHHTQPTGTNTSIRLIAEAAQQRMMKPLAFYYALKIRYRNSCIYQYRGRQRELSEQFAVSEKTVYNYLKVLTGHGLCYEHAGNLILTSTKAIKRKYSDRRKTTIHTQANDSLKEIEIRLYAKLIERHAGKMAFRESLRRFFIIRDMRKTEHDVNEFKPSLSLSNTADVLHLSIRKTTSVIQQMNELKIITSTPPKPQRMPSSFNHKINIFEDLPGHYFNTSYGLFRIFGTTHNFNEYPVKLKKITKKLYLKYSNTVNCKKDNNLLTV